MIMHFENLLLKIKELSLSKEDKNKIQEQIEQIMQSQHSPEIKNLILDNISGKLNNIDNELPNDIFELKDIYLVGGAVRDIVLGIDSRDKDYVLVNYTKEKLLSLGFQQVSSESFPVYLDSNGVEFALARTERKNQNQDNKNAYLNFETFTENVTLEDDLSRRDLTINAMAMKLDWQFNVKENAIIDPYNGLEDMANQTLRHVSNAFQEDPVRILRTCRFAARYNFKIADETHELMKNMVSQNLLNYETIPAERFFKEFEKGLSENYAYIMIEEMHKNGSLKYVIPELDKLFGIPQPAEHHPEICSGIHTLMVLQQACQMNLSPKAKFACLMHDLGKGITPPELLPKHHQHEKNGVPIVETVCDRLKVPRDWKVLAMTVCAEHLNIHNAEKLNPTTLVKLLKRTNGINSKNNLFQELVECSMCDSRGRLGFENREYPQRDFLFNLQYHLDSKNNNALREKIQNIALSLTEQNKKEIIPIKIYETLVTETKKIINQYYELKNNVELEYNTIDNELIKDNKSLKIKTI